MDSQPRPLQKKAWTIVAGLVILGVIGYWWITRGPNVGPPPPRKITITQAGDFFLYAPLYLAKDAGIFAKKGLEVSLVSTGGDEKTWAAIISKSASFGVADPTFVAISDARGQPGRVIASVVNGVPFWGIALDPAIPQIADAKGLDSYTVGTFPAPSTAYTLQKDMFLQAGLTPKIREGAFGTLLAMLKSKQVDIALELEPNVSQAVLEGAHIVYAMPAIYGDFAITGLTASPELLTKEPKLAEDVVCSLQLALDFARNHPDETLQILTKRFPEINPSVAKAALTRVLEAGIVPRDTVVQRSAWDKAITLRVKVGDLSAPKNIEAYIDNTFATRAQTTCREK
jgi:NitT/TauT family transport system substrate-binding protein